MKKLLIIPIVLVLLVACSNSDHHDHEHEIQKPEFIEVIDGWVRSGNAGMMTAAYFTIQNETSKDDSLLSISTPNAIEAQIHESFESEEGTMGMRPMRAVFIPSSSSVELKPGGIHIMVIQPSSDLNEGDTVEFNLQFSEAGEVLIELPVRRN